MAFYSERPKPRYRPGEYAKALEEERLRWSNIHFRPKAPERPKGIPFHAELDLTELDTVGRPMLTFTAKASELGESHICIRSRRMCYTTRRIIAAMHALDDQPVPVYGEVDCSDYDGNGLYLTRVRLMELPSTPELLEWLKEQGIRGVLV
ncbi:MAG: hypothetical protein AB7G11_12815 [Phycisphaerales bacterium]